MKDILVAVDGSVNSKEAFEYSLEEAKDLNNNLTALRVVPGLGYGGKVVEKALKEEIEAAKKFLQKLKDQAKGEGVEIKTDVITATSVATEIVKYADEHDIDLIVVGSRGNTDLQTISLGSVSEGVVKRAHCPVLVVR